MIGRLIFAAALLAALPALAQAPPNTPICGGFPCFTSGNPGTVSVTGGTGLTNTQTPVAPATATATKGVLGGLQYNATPPTATDGQQGAEQGDPHLSLKSIAVDQNGNTIDPTQGAPTVPFPSASATVGIALITSAALESCHVLKASPGNLYEISVVNTDTAADWLMVFNATSAPGDGAVTPARVIQVAANNGLVSVSAGGGPPTYFNTGITVCLSSTGPFTKTAATKAVFMAKSM